MQYIKNTFKGCTELFFGLFMLWKLILSCFTLSLHSYGPLGYSPILLSSKCKSLLLLHRVAQVIKQSNLFWQNALFFINHSAIFVSSKNLISNSLLFIFNPQRQKLNRVGFTLIPVEHWWNIFLSWWFCLDDNF